MLKKILLITALLSLALLFFINGGDEYFNFACLKQYKDELLRYTDAHFWQSFFIVGALYIVSTVLSLPGAAIMSIAIGYIFGLWYGVLLATTASTIGAALVFWMARYLFADWVRQRLEKTASTQKIMRNLEQDAFSYLLFMRAVPLFPFWFVNMIFAFSPISSKHYIVGSYIGMFPVSVVIVNLGSSLATVDTMNDFFTAEVLLSFALIAFVALIAAILVRRQKHKMIARENS